MTLRHMDGFDLGDQDLRYPSSPAGSLSTSTRFGYGRCWSRSGGAELLRSVTAASVMIAGAAFKVASGQTAYLSFWGDSGVTRHVTVVVKGDGGVEVRRGTTSGTVLASLGAGTLTSDTWCYVEARVTVADSGGTVKVRLNGAGSNAIDFTGDTKNGGTATNIDAVSLGSGASTAYVDDWYVADTAGSVNNDFLGDVRVYTLAPNGNGNSSQMTGSDGNSTDNYALVDEQPYSASDYVGSATTGHKDTYAMTDLPGTVTTVLGVQEVAVVAKSDAGAATIKQVVRSGGADYATSAVTLGTSYATLVNLRESDPATATAWTPSGVNSAEAGVEVG
jgi:hypothetical protein